MQILISLIPILRPGQLCSETVNDVSPLPLNLDILHTRYPRLTALAPLAWTNLLRDWVQMFAGALVILTEVRLGLHQFLLANY